MTLAENFKKCKKKLVKRLKRKNPNDTTVKTEKD